jgi:hypothetical protein
LKKPNFYGSRQAFDAGAPHDGYVLERSNGSLKLVCRIQSRIYTLEQFDGGEQRYSDGMLAVRVSAGGGFRLDADALPPHATHTLDVGRYHAIRTLLRGITDSTRVHAVNVPLLSEADGGN